MARPRNEELRRNILTEFWKGFQKEGYEATSYGIVAQDLKTTKALIQYHYPKKEQIATAFVQRLLDESMDILHIESSSDNSENFANLYRLGQVLFAFLMQDEGHRLFTHDIVKSRELTETILAFNLEWDFKFIGYDASEEHKNPEADSIDQRIAFRMGGFFSLLYSYLEYNHPFDMRAGLRSALEAFIYGFGYKQAQADEMLASGEISDAELERDVAALNERMTF